MTSDDPFFSPPTDDRTILRPIPGGRTTDLKKEHVFKENFTHSEVHVPRLGRLNPLESASSGLLALLTRLNLSNSQADPSGLKEKIIREIQQFQVDAEANGIEHQTISSTRYVLCTALDEAVLNTPWGINSNWSQQSLLSLFHKEVSGGERFFLLLKSLSQNPGKNRYLLEIMYLCLSLGFEGRYRLIEGGKNKLVEIREWLYQILQQEKGPSERGLSPHWRGVTDKRNPMMKFIPLWIIGIISIGLLTLVFSFLLFQLNKDSDPVFREILSIKPPGVELPVPIPVPEPAPLPVPEPEPQLTLSLLLADEINQNQVQVKELAERSIAIIQGDNLFRSGSASVNKKVIPLLDQIAQALNQLNGQVLIVGHSDNMPIRSARYPSNWHLSKARANSVKTIIEQFLNDPQRINIEGRADLEPVTTNSTREGRAKNRRVEIILLK